MIGFRRARGLAPLLATALVALLALAAPAAANDGSHGDDDRPAGTIASYDADTGKLTIDLAKGGSISGVVTSRTWIDDGDHGCGDGDGDASRKSRAVRGGGKQARTGDWCHERRTGDHDGDGDGDGDGDRGWHHRWDKGDESDLVEGAVVEDAILILKDGRAWYAKVELDD